ncbi:hypothetical protein LXL04_029757 [Taraxacum kok-saghyz]
MMNDDKMKVPVFDGHFEHWSEMMENLLRAKQVWNLIDPGIRESAVGIAQSEAEKKKLEELRIKDLQIMDRLTSKAVWDSMKQRFTGNERVKRSMLQKLRRDFEILEMKNSETIPEYFSRVLTVSNQIRSNGELIEDVKIVEKILRTLTDKYMYEKFKRGAEKEYDQALKAEGGFSPNGGERGRARFNNRERGRGRGRLTFSKETIECYNYHKLRHYAFECPNAKEANYAGFEEDEEVMLMDEVTVEENAFMAGTCGRDKGMLWFLDSGCSHHMCGNKDRFFDFDLDFSNFVKLGNDTRMMVTRKGNVKLFLNGSTYVINDVYYVPDLKNNLLSIGQLQQKGIPFLFYPVSHTGNRYFISFIDDYSRKGWVYLLSKKSQALESFRQFEKKVETEIGKVVKALRTDRGGEYLSNEFRRTVINMVVSMITAKNMPKKFWGEATMWSFYMLNKCPTKALADMTPEEAWSGIKPTVYHFRVWGCIAHVHIPKQKRTKLDDKSFVCILTGVSDESKAYRLIDPQTLKVIVSKDVIFEEHKTWNWSPVKEGEDDKEITWGDYDFIDDDYEFVNEHLSDEKDNYDDENEDTSPPTPFHTSTVPGPSSDDQELNSDDNELNVTDLDHQDPIYYEDAIVDDR